MFVAGGIGHGEMIAAYLRMGAAGVQMGTAFVCAEESTAHPAFKQAFIRAAARDAVPSVQIDPEFKVIPVRALANDGTRRFTETQIEVIGRYPPRRDRAYEEASLAIEHYWAGALRRAVVDGDVENGSLMAGQSVGLVRRIQPVADDPGRAGRRRPSARWRAAREAPPARRSGGVMTASGGRSQPEPARRAAAAARVLRLADAAAAAGRGRRRAGHARSSGSTVSSS